jgi:hypothetical protein
MNAAVRVAGSDVVAGRAELIRGGRGREGTRCASSSGARVHAVTAGASPPRHASVCGFA